VQPAQELSCKTVVEMNREQKQFITLK